MDKTILSFKRYESKYLLSARKYAQLWEGMREHLIPDRYFASTVCSVYYDSEDFSLIRHSLERPIYKEKLRLRSYNVPGPEGEVFVELKKKFKGVVYKRRASMSAREAEAWLAGQGRPEGDGQIRREIDFFLQSHPVQPKVFIACDREAWVDREEPELRITFDRNLRWRETDLSLTAGSEGTPLLDEGEVLMEIKLPQAAPLWLAHLLSELEVFPTGFSKYGTCYRQNLLKKYFNGVIVCA